MGDDLAIKCQFCLRSIKSVRIAVEITKKIEQSFYRLTNTKLKKFQTVSPFICKRCVKELESSVGFQQKILSNQRRLVKFESEDPVPPKEEAVKPEELEIVEIKTECFEFEPSVVSQTWQEPAKVEVAELDIKTDQDDVPEESPASANSGDDFKEDFHNDDSSDSWESDHVEEIMIPKTKTKKKTSEANETRICPYCAGVYSRCGIKAHVERHENEINNKIIKCKYCDCESFSQTAITAHVRLKHPEKYKPKIKKKKRAPGSSKERRQIIIDAHLENPSMSFGALANKLNLGKSTIFNVVQRYKERKTIERAPKTSLPKNKHKEIHDKIARSFTSNPEWSDPVRAEKLGTSRTTVLNVRRKVGFQRDVDESTRIFQCKLCPKKYSHNQTLWTHVRDVHKRPKQTVE